jgi:hypothetical protein
MFNGLRAQNWSVNRIKYRLRTWRFHIIPPLYPPRFSSVVVHYPRTIYMDYPRFPETFRKSFAVVFGNLCLAIKVKFTHRFRFPTSTVSLEWHPSCPCCDEAHNIIYSIIIDRSRFNVMVVYNRKALHAIQKYQTNATVSQNSMTIFMQTKKARQFFLGGELYLITGTEV